MKKNNNKGFTLIELLAVVVILLAISVIAISSIGAAIERNKKKQNNNKIAVIESYAKLYYDEHKNSVTATPIPNKYRITITVNGVNTDIRGVSIYDLDLTDGELVDADGEYFCGYVSFSDFKFHENNDYCPEGENE